MNWRVQRIQSIGTSSGTYTGCPLGTGPKSLYLSDTGTVKDPAPDLRLPIELREDPLHIGGLFGVDLGECRIMSKVTDLIGCKDDFPILVVRAAREGVPQDLQIKRPIHTPG